MALNIYNNAELVNQIKNIFTEDDIKIFEFNYTLYKNFKGKEENFLIDFDEVYKFVGFAQKVHAKRLLKKHFTENIDYKMNNALLSQLGEQKNGRGGSNKELILLNLNCYKLYCLYAATDYSKKIYNYYIKMENIIHTFIENQLENKDKEILQIKNELNSFKNFTYRDQDKTGNIYVMSTDKPNIYKIGRTKDVKKRKAQLQTSVISNIEVLYEYKTCDDILLEYILHNVLNKYNINKEHYSCELEYIKLMIDNIGNLIHVFKSSYENITRNELTERLLSTLNNKEYINNIINGKKEDNDIYLQFLNECTEYSDTHISTKDLYIKFHSFYSLHISSFNIPSNRIFVPNIKRHKIVEHVKVSGETFFGIKNLKCKEL